MLRPFTIEEASLVAGLPPSFQLGDKRAVARRLVGSTTPPALLRTLLHRCGDGGDGEGGDGMSIDVSPPRKKVRLDHQSSMVQFLVAPADGSLACNLGP